MNLTQLFIGQLLEAIYFALFMIYAKNIKEKRILFIMISIIQYFISLYIFDFNIWFHVSYTFMMFFILKFLYKEQSQIIDIFTFTLGSILLIIISSIIYVLFYMLLHLDFTICAIISKITLFIVLFSINNKFYNIQKLYKQLWNRNDKKDKKIKSITFRCWNLVLFNIIFYLIGLILQNINII